MLSKITYTAALLSVCATANQETAMAPDEAQRNLGIKQDAKNFVLTNCVGLTEDECISLLCDQFPNDCRMLYIWMKKKVKYAYCKMQEDLGNPTTNPFGLFAFKDYLWPYTPMEIKGWMQNLPYDDRDYGLTINKWAVNQFEPYCRETFPHFNPYGNNHGPMNAVDSHVGDLNTFYVSPGNSSATYFNPNAQKPTLWGPASNRVMNRSLVVYETKEMQRPIACCKITKSAGPIDIDIDIDGEEDEKDEPIEKPADRTLTATWAEPEQTFLQP